VGSLAAPGSVVTDLTPWGRLLAPPRPRQASKARGGPAPPRLGFPPGRGSADLAVALHHVAGGGQGLQSHGAPGVELLGADPHLGAEAELAAVGEPGGGVDVD